MNNGNSAPARRGYGHVYEADKPIDDKEVQPTTISDMERKMIKDTLENFSGSRRKTARALQISERTLYRKINEYGL